MCVKKSKSNLYSILFFLVFIKLCFLNCLVELPSAKDYDIIAQDIKNYFIINKLFAIIKLKDFHPTSTITEYSSLYKNVVSLNFHYYKNLRDVKRLVKATSKENDKSTSDFVAVINEFLEENSLRTGSEIESEDDKIIITYIDNFLNNLLKLKEGHNVSGAYVGINKKVVKLSKIHDEPVNNSSKYTIDKDESHEFDFDDNEFWEPSGRRIFKGERSKIKYFPFMSAIQIFNNFHCAGSIIKSDLIVTASSCLQLAWNNRFFRENPSFLTARVGSSFFNSGGEVIPILEVYFHPLYDPKTLRNNICVLRLTKHLKFRRRSKRIKKIDIDRNESPLAMNTPGITIVGWGAREHSPVVGNPWKYTISYAVLDIYILKDCQDIYSREYVTKKNFCAGFLSRGGGACNKDVGGPGVVDGKLMGVISFGSPVCGTPDAPTVFTKIGYYADWIEQLMEQDVPVSKKRTTLKPYIDKFKLSQTTRPPRPTTFKIPPITDETMAPIPISQIDNQLRIIDEKLFKDFLATMFNSKVIEEYKDLLKDTNQTPVNVEDTEFDEGTEKIEVVTKIEEVPESYTKIKDFSFEGNQKTGYTIIDDNIYIKDTLDNEFAKIIENMDLEKIVEEEIVRHKNKIASRIKSANESVVTLLYISDNEKNGKLKLFSEKNTKGSSNEGMSIAVDNYKDLTRTRDGSSILPESELYGLLSEVIGEEINNIDIKPLTVFIKSFHAKG